MIKYISTNVKLDVHIIKIKCSIHISTTFDNFFGKVTESNASSSIRLYIKIVRIERIQSLFKICVAFRNLGCFFVVKGLMFMEVSVVHDKGIM